MTDLAYQKEKQSSSGCVDIRMYAAQRQAARKRKAIALQHRYGLALVAMCAVLAVMALTGRAAEDLTAVLLLLPLGIYLLVAKEVLLYMPAMRTSGARRGAAPSKRYIA